MAVAAEDPWLGANPFDPEVRNDPYPFLARLREIDPVNETPVGFWRLLRYDDVNRLLHDVPAGVRTTAGELPNVDEQHFGPRLFMLQQDPPTHTRLRKLVSHGVHAARRRRLARRDPAHRRRLPRPRRPAWRDGRHRRPGTPGPRHAHLPDDGRPGGGPRPVHRVDGEGHLRSRRRRRPARADAGCDGRSDGARGVLPGPDRGPPVAPDRRPAERAHPCRGGRRSPVAARADVAGHGPPDRRLRDDDRPHRQRRPAADPSSRRAGEAPRAIPGSSPARSRNACASTGRSSSRRGSCTPTWSSRAASFRRTPRSGACSPSANRDPAHFPDPDRFDVARTPNEHLAFGGGPHYCLGAHLARTEAQLAIGSLVERFDDLALVSDTVEWGPSLFRVPGRLPITFRAR